MIGKLSGIIDSFGEASIILDVSGVGYLVQASRRTLEKCGQTGDAVSLRIETNVREDAITLFGFIDEAEQSWFKLLTSVQGVGAKAGLSILSVCPPETLQIAIMSQDKAAITRADGVGPKLATRILTELKDKAGKMASLNIAPASNNAATSPDAVEAASTSNQAADPSIQSDAISALVNLGYGRSEAFTAVSKAIAAGNDNVQDLIREALKELSA